MITLDKVQTARILADAHRSFDPAIIRIVRLIDDAEQDASEPIKLLQVNPDTSPSGIVPIAFGADPPRVPFPSVVIEVTQGEFEKISSGSLPLPEGWHLGETIYPSL